MKRCKWCNLNNPLYVKYHDEEWCKLNLDEDYLLEMLILETFQAGLSWEIILNKRENFRQAFDNFDIRKIANYDDKRVENLLANSGIIRSKQKIISTVSNAQILLNIKQEYGSFNHYLEGFHQGQIIYEIDKTYNDLSIKISKKLRQKDMKYVGEKIIYSFLQAIGIIYSHDEDCFLYKNNPTL